MFGVFVIVSSKEIKDDDVDLFCICVVCEYKLILKLVNGNFMCLGELFGDVLLEFEIIVFVGLRWMEWFVNKLKLVVSVFFGFLGVVVGS